MSITQGDYIEVYTWGNFNNVNEIADNAALSTDGFFHGAETIVAGILVLTKKAYSALMLSVKSLNSIQTNTEVK